jgi:hypothetical protein
MNNTLSLEFEIVATEIAARVFPQFRFTLSYHQPPLAKRITLKFQGHKNRATNILSSQTSKFQEQDALFFNADFYPHSRCLSLETRFEDKKYSLFHHSIGYLFWSIDNRKNIVPPSSFQKEFEDIVTRLYPMLEEFFLG